MSEEVVPNRLEHQLLYRLSPVAMHNIQKWTIMFVI
jgi:hypothetical protein